MRILLTSTGVDSGVPLTRLEITLPDGSYTYESRAVSQMAGRLDEADTVQLQRLIDAVNWDQEVLNSPTRWNHNTRFELTIEKDGQQRLYQFSDWMQGPRSWEFKDLVHFLRHNVAFADAPGNLSPGEAPSHSRPDL